MKKQVRNGLMICLLLLSQRAFAESGVTEHTIYQCAQNNVPASLPGLTLRGRGYVELLLPISSLYHTSNTLDRISQCLLHNRLTTPKRLQQYREAVLACREEKSRNKVRYSEGKIGSQISTLPAGNLYSCLLSEAGNL